MEGVLILLLAMGVDLLVGEPPRPIHPVVWMGKGAQLLERCAPAAPRLQIFYGAGVVLVVATLSALPVWVLLSFLKAGNAFIYILLSSLLLKSAFSVRELWAVASRIMQHVAGKRLEAGRRELQSLVSRDTNSLNEALVVSATVESVAENVVDSFISPIFFYAFFGVPGALAYRAVNTLDAMIGYHGRYEYLGKAAAKLDDGLNFFPARIGAVLIAVLALLSGRGTESWRIMIRHHGRTESPNAGWPMSAMAGALGVTLEKVGFYRLGCGQGMLHPGRIAESLRLMVGVVLIVSLIYVISQAAWHGSLS